MPELTIDNFLLIRSPAYSYENFTIPYLKKALQTDFFRAAIFFASQTFYIELKKKNFDYEQLNENVRLTLWKYLNRMCFRPLPYGLFSSFSAAFWATEDNDNMYFSDNGELVVQPDFKLIIEYINRLDTDSFDSLKYYNNNSIYQSGRQLRFISQGYTALHQFVIVQLKVVPGLNKLLKFISKGRTKGAILDFLTEEYGNELPVSSYFDSLKEGQLIVSELTPNVTGTDYNSRCLSLLQKYPVADLKSLQSFTAVLNSNNGSFPILNLFIDQLVSKNIENSTYSLYERKIEGGADPVIKKELITLISQLDKLTAGQETGVMNAFKAKFIEKYELREVSLMEVLDPGYGIGYENMATVFDAGDERFIEGLRVKQEQKRKTAWGPVEKMIFKKWNNLRKSGTGKILITAEDLHELPESDHVLPPGLFILFKRSGNENWIDHVGGVSGIELSTRFGVSGSAVEKQLQEICKTEMAVNIDYVFAEIAFSPNDRASNINRRGVFYTYEIPILTHPTLPAEYTIELSDLMVSVFEGRVLLRSVRLNKYIIPRLSSAYNYHLSVIPVFRFLCDLQFQGVKSNLSLSLTDLFPEMDYYPRVQLENAVLSPATWILNEQQLKQISAGDDRFFKEEKNLTTYFSLHDGDNFLVFSKNSEEDLAVFKRCIRNRKSAKLTEYIFPERIGLQNKAGQPFVSQLLACVTNKERSYVLPENQLKETARQFLKVKRSFLPGEEWLYIKLYTHYSLMDEILMEAVLPVVKKYKKDNPGFKWFFLRYQDPDYHLRLRFYPAEKSSYTLLADLIHKLQPLSRSGKIADVMLDSYQRELEKYSAQHINEIESFFYHNSEFILTTFLINPLTTAFKLSFAVNYTLKLIQCFIENSKERDDFFSKVFHNLSAEFSQDKEVIRKMDGKYRKFQKELIAYNKLLSVQKNKEIYASYLQIMNELKNKVACWKQADRYNLLINLIHVHINRIFQNNAREYEYLIYHFMKKHQSYLNYNING